MLRKQLVDFVSTPLQDIIKVRQSRPCIACGITELKLHIRDKVGSQKIISPFQHAKLVPIDIDLEQIDMLNVVVLYIRGQPYRWNRNFFNLAKLSIKPCHS